MKEKQLKELIKLLETPNSSPLRFTPAVPPPPSPSWLVQKLDKHFKQDSWGYWTSGNRKDDENFRRLVQFNRRIEIFEDGNLVTCKTSTKYYSRDDIQLNATKRQACIDYLNNESVVQMWIHQPDDANSESSESDDGI